METTTEINPTGQTLANRKRAKKLRMNRLVHKAIVPKNAMITVNELKGVVITNLSVNMSAGGGFKASVTVNNKAYEGFGFSKMEAMNDAYEKVFRDFVIEKMLAKDRKKIAENNGDGSTISSLVAEKESVGDEAFGGTQETDVTDDKTQGGLKTSEDEVPMTNLVSFALFKLLSEWERDGYFVPQMHSQQQQQQPSGSGNEDCAVPTTKKRKIIPTHSELPAKWETLHPTTLLSMMIPCIPFVDCGIVGVKRHGLQRFSVTVGDHEFIAEGRSKKIARRKVSIIACNTLFGTNFVA